MSFAPGGAIPVVKGIFPPLDFEQKQTILVKEGAKNTTLATCTVGNQTATDLSFTIEGNNKNNVMSRHQRIVGKRYAFLTGKNSKWGSALLQDGAWSVRPYQIQFNSTTATQTYNGNLISSWKPSITLPMTLPYKSELIDLEDANPMELDNCSSYDTFIGTSRNINGNISQVPIGVNNIPRGAYNGVSYRILRNDSTPAGPANGDDVPTNYTLYAVVEIDINEAILSPANCSKLNGVSGYINVDSMEYTFTTDYSASIAVAPSSGSVISSSTAGGDFPAVGSYSAISKPAYDSITVQVYKFKPNILTDTPDAHKYDFYSFNLQTYNITSGISPNQVITTTINSIKPDYMPDSVIIAVSDTTRNSAVPHRFLQLRNLNMEVDSVPNLMAQYNKIDFYTMSKTNGCNYEYIDFIGQANSPTGVVSTAGCPTLLKFGSDIPLDNRVANQRGSIDLVFTATHKNTTGQTIPNATLYALYITKGVLYVSGDSTVEVRLGLISEHDVLSAKRVSLALSGGSFFDSVKNFYNSKVKPIADVVSKGIDVANKFAGNGMTGGTLIEDGEVRESLFGGRALPKKKVKKSLY